MPKRAPDLLETPTAPGAPDTAGTPFNPEVHAQYRTGRAMTRRDGTYFPKGGAKPTHPPVNGEGYGVKPARPTTAAQPTPAHGDPAAGVFKGWETPPVAPAEPVAPATTEPTPSPQPAATASTLGDIPGDTVGADGTPSPPAAPPAAGAMENKARALVSAIELSGRMVLGPDMEHTTEERDTLAEAWARYFEANGGGPEMSPGMAVALGYFALVVQRVERPTFRERCAAIWRKITGA